MEKMSFQYLPLGLFMCTQLLACSLESATKERSLIFIRQSPSSSAFTKSEVIIVRYSANLPLLYSPYYTSQLQHIVPPSIRYDNSQQQYQYEVNGTTFIGIPIHFVSMSTLFNEFKNNPSFGIQDVKAFDLDTFFKINTIDITLQPDTWYQVSIETALKGGSITRYSIMLEGKTLKALQLLYNDLFAVHPSSSKTKLPAQSWYALDGIMFYDKQNKQLGTDMFIVQQNLTDRFTLSSPIKEEDSTISYTNYYCFTNFWKQSFTLDSVTWPTTEHYFQLGKADPKDWPMLLPKTAGQVFQEIKKLIKPQFDWTTWTNTESKQRMLKALYAKFSQNSTLKAILLSTDPLPIVEAARLPKSGGGFESKDHLWGAGADGKTGFNIHTHQTEPATNMIGLSLMAVRWILKHQSTLGISDTDALTFLTTSYEALLRRTYSDFPGTIILKNNTDFTAAEDAFYRKIFNAWYSTIKPTSTKPASTESKKTEKKTSRPPSATASHPVVGALKKLSDALGALATQIP